MTDQTKAPQPDAYDASCFCGVLLKVVDEVLQSAKYIAHSSF